MQYGHMHQLLNILTNLTYFFEGSVLLMSHVI